MANGTIPGRSELVMSRLSCSLSVDVEEWFHILDSPAAPHMSEWTSLECRVAGNVERLLEICAQTHSKATFFWMGWLARRNRGLVQKCKMLGHEIASHGYAHHLPYKVGRKAFREDVLRAKGILEEITGERVVGFRAAGFGITRSTAWAFEAIREAGHLYDSSVFPALRGHGGMPKSPMGWYVVPTSAGPLFEWPVPVVEAFHRRFCVFGGGYLRLAPKSVVRWGLRKLEAGGRPLFFYVHPREVDPEHPRLRVGLKRWIMCYIGLKSLVPKLRWLCDRHDLRTMWEVVRAALLGQSTLRRHIESKGKLVFRSWQGAPVA